MAAVTSAGRASGLEPLGLGLDSGLEEALYRRNAGRVFGFCLAQLGRREDAEDAVQTTFLHAVRSLRRGVVPLLESAWLLGIARNVCRERWEIAGRRARLESTCDPQDLEREPAAAAEAPREELIGLEDALARLPDQQRRAILLRDWRGLSYAEVAEQLGVSRAAVETLIFRGRGTLAALLREEPKQTKRRLASLGHLGSLFSALKTAFGGAAAATKIAAAVGVTAVAVGGASVAISTSSSAPKRQPAVQVPGTPAPDAARPQAAPAPTAAAKRPARARVAAAGGSAAGAATKVAPATSGSPAREKTEHTDAPPPPAGSPPPPGAPHTPVAAPHVPAAAAAKPKLPLPPPATLLGGSAQAPVDPLPPVTNAVENLVQSPPVQAVANVVAPVTEPVKQLISEVVPPLPPVTVTPPPLVPLPPVTITPPPLPKLLP